MQYIILGCGRYIWIVLLLASFALCFIFLCCETIICMERRFLPAGFGFADTAPVGWSKCFRFVKRKHGHLWSVCLSRLNSRCHWWGFNLHWVTGWATWSGDERGSVDSEIREKIEIRMKEGILRNNTPNSYPGTLIRILLNHFVMGQYSMFGV